MCKYIYIYMYVWITRMAQFRWANQCSTAMSRSCCRGSAAPRGGPGHRNSAPVLHWLALQPCTFSDAPVSYPVTPHCPISPFGGWDSKMIRDILPPGSSGYFMIKEATQTHYFFNNPITPCLAGSVSDVSWSFYHSFGAEFNWIPTSFVVFTSSVLEIPISTISSCGFQKSCINLDGWNPKNNGINHRYQLVQDFFPPPYPHVFWMLVKYPNSIKQTCWTSAGQPSI